MRMRVVVPFVVGVFVLILGAPLSAADGCDHKIVPAAKAPPASDGEDSCAYTHIPVESITYQEGELTVTWPERFDVEEAFLLADFEVVGAYNESLAASIERESKRERYDLALRVHDKATGKDYVGLTRLWCKVDGAFRNAWEEDCEETTTLDCSVTSDVPCADGSTARVTCRGGRGTCSDHCSGDGTACCTSTTQSEEGTTLTTTHFQRVRECPTPLPAQQVQPVRAQRS